jgi:cob(I)alamin adenosyltransferase
MKIYTGGGDRGKTSLLSGERVPKSHPQIEACGDLDELCSIIGGIKTVLPPNCQALSAELYRIQSNLLTIGAFLAASKNSQVLNNIPKICHEHVQMLETAIDTMQAGLPELKGFLLPNGHISSVMAHIARTVCRRAERRVVGLSLEIDVGHMLNHLQYQMIYLNRLSDYLFTLARYCNHLTEVTEDIWKA